MRREPTIPLFLWVTTALVVHAIFGGGATEVVQVLEERLDIRGFAHLVSEQARLGSEPLEISLADEPAPPEPPLLGPGNTEAKTEETDEDVTHHDPEAEPEEVSEKEAPEAVEPKAEKKPPEAKPPETKPPEPEAKKPPEKEAEAKPDTEKPPMQVQLDNRRTAVIQHVEDENQEDNPNARFAAEHANRVDQETQARVTSNDGADGKPTLSGAEPKPTSEHGNADESKFAQSEDVPGQHDRSVGEGGNDVREEAGSIATPHPTPPDLATPPPAQAARAAPPAEQAIEASQARQGNPETLASDFGRFTMPNAQSARKAQQGRAALPGRKGGPPEDFLGYGSQSVTKNGVNLNLSYSAAQAMIGVDKIAAMRKRAGEKRLSQHRGSFQNLGLDKWRPAIENYVASVQPGNQTALNTARVPFARYLNEIHQRLHEIFADGFLGSLDGLPPSHPLSNQSMSTHLEIALSHEDGRIVKMGITKTSGVTMFDVGALEAVKKAGPYGVPPGSIVSSDGNVYLHWEFHRNPELACSTYFARPFILNLPQKPAPPRVEPPPRKDYDEKPADERSGSNTRRRGQPTIPG